MSYNLVTAPTPPLPTTRSAYEDISRFVYQNAQAAILIDGVTDVIWIASTVGYGGLCFSALAPSVIGAFTTYMIRDIAREWYDHGYIGGIIGGMTKYSITGKDLKDLFAGAFNNLGYEIFKAQHYENSFVNTAISTITVEAGESIFANIFTSSPASVKSGAQVGTLLAVVIHAIYEPTAYIMDHYLFGENVAADPYFTEGEDFCTYSYISENEKLDFSHEYGL